MDYKAGIIQLSSSDGASLEIPETKLSDGDLNYVRSLGVYKKGKREVTPFLSRFLISFSNVIRNRNPGVVCAQSFRVLFSWLGGARLSFRLQTAGRCARTGVVPACAARKSIIYPRPYPAASSEFHDLYDWAGTLGSRPYRSHKRGQSGGPVGFGKEEGAGVRK